MRLIFQGRNAEATPAPLRESRVIADGHNTPQTATLVLGAMEDRTELVLLNSRLTPRERAAQRESIGGIPPAGEPAVVLFTSGTTGTPKAARLARDNLEANARAANEVLEVDSRSRFLCVLPLFHVGGLGILFRCQLAGATVLLHERFDPQAVARELREGATHTSLVSSTLARVLEHGAAFPPAIVAVGGGPVPGPLLERARKAGLCVVQTWGMTETCSMATCERPRDADGATAGPPLPGFEVAVDAEEILVRGPAMMRGYLGQPPLQGSFFRTGDLGELDARGRLIVHARRGDLIVSGGENVYPAEVEAALLAHPSVREAAVLPASDERWGQIGVAYVVTTASDGELRDFLEARIAKYKVPARFVHLRELPRNAAGKVDRAGLLAHPERTQS
ncbi:MAG TPA: AMP-binding protein [Myxococcales bacterium]|nr:AMP-binding protein [Myxococcales bacterium]